MTTKAPEADSETNMEDSSSSDWILDSLVTYLRGPIWIMPILNFIEQKSVVFEGQGDHEVEYKRIHDEFRNLVDCMLGAYMDDLGLQPDDLETALGQIRPSVRSAALHELLEPVQAAGDYDRFKHLMKTKNEQLHNEAVELLRRKHGDPNHLAEGGAEPDEFSNFSFSEEDINEAIRQSLVLHAAERDAYLADKRKVDRALAISTAGLLKSNAEEAVLTNTPTDLPSDAAVEANKGKGGPMDAEEIERRRANLRLQRDKILSQKRKEREMHLMNQQEQDERVSGSSRPKSGRAARAALAGETAPQVDERTIQYRRLLLQKIKEEVEGPSKS